MQQVSKAATHTSSLLSVNKIWCAISEADGDVMVRVILVSISHHNITIRCITPAHQIQ